MSDFKIAAAQIASVRSDIDANIAAHAAAIATSAEQGVAVLVFPELSLTGYETELAAELALTPGDGRLAPLAFLAQKHRMEVVVGAPLRNTGAKPGLGAIIFGATGMTRTYSKMHLGGSEEEHFAPGGMPLTIDSRGQTIGIAICADAAQPSHPEAYAQAGATVYAAGVFLNAEWFATDVPRLAAHASRFGMLVVMANHADSVGTHESVGMTTIWAPGGALVAQAEGRERVLVMAIHDGNGWRGDVVSATGRSSR